MVIRGSEAPPIRSGVDIRLGRAPATAFGFELVDHPEHAGGVVAGGPAAHPCETPVDERGSKGRITENSRDASRDITRIARIHEQRRISKLVGGAGNVRGNHRTPELHRLEWWQVVRAEKGRKDQRSGARV